MRLLYPDWCVGTKIHYCTPVADLGFLKGGFRFRLITVIARIVSSWQASQAANSAPIRAKRGKFSEFRTFEIASAGFSGPIQRALVRRSSKLPHLFHRPCGADSFLLLITCHITSQRPCRQIFIALHSN